jgi:hypothetical protein
MLGDMVNVLHCETVGTHRDLFPDLPVAEEKVISTQTINLLRIKTHNIG